jgi:hypothetical protein
MGGGHPSRPPDVAAVTDATGAAQMRIAQWTYGAKVQLEVSGVPFPITPDQIRTGVLLRTPQIYVHLKPHQP